MRRLSPVLRSVPLLALPLLTGCLVAAVGLTAAVASQEFRANATVGFLKEDHRLVWDQAKQTLTYLSLDPIEIEEEAMAARANVDGAKITLHVQIHDVNETRLAVGARKWGLYDSDAASDVLERIKNDLDR